MAVMAREVNNSYRKQHMHDFMSNAVSTGDLLSPYMKNIIMLPECSSPALLLSCLCWTVPLRKEGLVDAVF